MSSKSKTEMTAEGRTMRKLQIQAWNAQSELLAALTRLFADAEDDDPVVKQYHEAFRVTRAMSEAGYAPQRWGTGLVARYETGDETPEQLSEYDNAEWGTGM